MKVFFGILLLLLAIIAEIFWLSFCFESVIIGILLLFFAPRILFFPFNFILPFVLILIFKDRIKSFKHGDNYSNSSHFKNLQYRSDLNKYYDLLESKESDDFQIIKSNYRRLIKKYHYDSVISQKLSKEDFQSAENITKKLNEAYSIIKNIKKSKKSS